MFNDGKIDELEEYINNKFKIDCKQYKPFLSSHVTKFINSLDKLKH